MYYHYLYDNSVAGYSKIHRADCTHCRNGVGPSGAPVGPGEQFIRASSADEARLRAEALGRKPTYCKVCLPQLN